MAPDYASSLLSHGWRSGALGSTCAARVHDTPHRRPASPLHTHTRTRWWCRAHPCASARTRASAAWQ
eukprot:4658080-Pleurochrysis_carterae.AAC.1